MSEEHEIEGAEAPSENTAEAEPAPGVLLRVSDLQIEMTQRRGSAVTSIRGVSFEIPRGGIFALVGVTGSGKSEIALSLTGLLPSYYAEVRSGEVWFDGDDLLPGHDANCAICEPLGSPIFFVNRMPC